MKNRENQTEGKWFGYTREIKQTVVSKSCELIAGSTDYDSALRSMGLEVRHTTHGIQFFSSLS